MIFRQAGGGLVITKRVFFFHLRSARRGFQLGGGGGDFGGRGANHNFLVNGLIYTEACKQLIMHTIEEEKIYIYV